MTPINQYAVAMKTGETVYVEAHEIQDDTDNGMYRFIKDDHLVGEYRKSDVSGWHISWMSESSG